MWEMHDGSGWWMVYGAFWMIVFWGILIAGVAWLVARLTRHQQGSDSPIEIARSRYARGEISQEEFERITEHLLLPSGRIQ
jgi:putative membrane protein